MIKLALIVALSLAGTLSAQAAERSRAVRAEFQRSNPCPATGATRGRCDGWQVDHVRSLCSGGVDHPTNLAWISVEDHKRKTVNDVAICKAQKVGVLPR